MEFSNIEPGVADILLRSRQTILDILEDRGYDTTIYRNIAPEQILTLAEKDARALDIVVKKRADSPVVAPCERAIVAYMIQDRRLRTRLATVLRDDIYKEGDGATLADDVIVLLNEPYESHEVFDKASLQHWQTHKARLTFFHIKQVVVHLGRHVLVPPHRKLTAEESKAEMARLHITQKSQFPLIKHSDIQSRIMGLVPGDLVEILRPSPTAGVARVFRICAA
jgi:DNA-directed RNA polymerase subunit H (RpoH/RPB5)